MWQKHQKVHQIYHLYWRTSLTSHGLKTSKITPESRINHGPKVKCVPNSEIILPKKELLTILLFWPVFPEAETHGELFIITSYFLILNHIFQKTNNLHMFLLNPWQGCDIWLSLPPVFSLEDQIEWYLQFLTSLLGI